MSIFKKILSLFFISKDTNTGLLSKEKALQRITELHDTIQKEESKKNNQNRALIDKMVKEIGELNKFVRNN